MRLKDTRPVEGEDDDVQYYRITRKREPKNKRDEARTNDEVGEGSGRTAMESGVYYSGTM